MSLVAAGLMGLVVELALPPVTATAEPLSGSVNLADLGSTVTGTIFNGITDSDFAGYSVSTAGDVNGDGLDDLLIGAIYANDQGQVYLVYGQDDETPLSGSLDLADLGAAVAGATFNGINNNDQSGWSVSGAGDVNGDGLADILIGAPNANQTYLVYGQPNGSLLSGSLDLANVGGSVAGATFNEIDVNDAVGLSVSSAGDVNGDGLADLLIATPYADATGSSRGQSYLVYGRRESRVTWIDPGNDAWDDHLNWFGFEGPGAGDDAFIHPINGLTVSGPTSATQMDSFTLGAQQAGTVNLVVDPAGALLINQILTIEADGRLSGSGTVTAVGEIINQGEIDLGSQGLNLAGGKLLNTGVVRGGGTIDNAMVNSTGGEVHVAAGQQMHLTDTSEQGNGCRIDVVGHATQAAEIEFDGRLTNAKVIGNITARHAIMRFNGGLTNQGNVGISFGISGVYGDVDNQSKASITVTGYSNVTFWDDLVNGGIINVIAGSTAVYFGSVSGNSFTGSGTTFVEGDLSPGSSPGTMSFGGDVVLGTASTTQIELGGTAPGEYDQLDIAGSVSLASTLDAMLINGFSPGLGDTFTIISADGGVTGTFATTNMPGLGGGLSLDVAYHPTFVALEVIFNFLLGDANNDNQVTGADLVIVQQNFGNVDPNTPTDGLFPGDANDDGQVTGADLIIVQQNFGNTLGPVGAEVPEPASVCLLALAALGVLVRRHTNMGFWV